MPGNTDSYCERCGTRYVFQIETPRKRPLQRAMVLVWGLRNFVVTDGQSLGESLALAERESDGHEGAQLADAFQRTFNFCMICRQYACDACWNPDQTACLSCAPMGGPDAPYGMRPVGFSGGDPGLLFPDILAADGSPLAARGDARAREASAPAAWPANDLVAASAESSGTDADVPAPIAAPATRDELVPPPTVQPVEPDSVRARTRGPSGASRTRARSDRARATDAPVQAATEAAGTPPGGDELLDTETWLEQFTLGPARTPEPAPAAIELRPARPGSRQEADRSNLSGTAAVVAADEAGVRAEASLTAAREAATAGELEAAASGEPAPEVIEADAGRNAEQPAAAVASEPTSGARPDHAATGQAPAIGEGPSVGSELEPAGPIPGPAETAPIPAAAPVTEAVPPTPARGRILSRLTFRGADDRGARSVAPDPWPRPTFWQDRPRAGRGWLTASSLPVDEPRAGEPVAAEEVDRGPAPADDQAASDAFGTGTRDSILEPALAESGPDQPAALESEAPGNEGPTAEVQAPETETTGRVPEPFEAQPADGAAPAHAAEQVPEPAVAAEAESEPAPAAELLAAGEAAAEVAAVTEPAPAVEAAPEGAEVAEPVAVEAAPEAALSEEPVAADKVGEPVPSVQELPPMPVAAPPEEAQALEREPAPAAIRPVEHELSEVEQAALARIAAIGWTPTVEPTDRSIDESLAAISGTGALGPVASGVVQAGQSSESGRELPAGWPPLGASWPAREAPGAPWSVAQPGGFHPAAATREQPGTVLSQVWEQSSEAVLSRGSARVCRSCSLPLSTLARYCRRSGTRQD